MDEAELEAFLDGQLAETLSQQDVFIEDSLSSKGEEALRTCKSQIKGSVHHITPTHHHTISPASSTTHLSVC